MPAPSFFEPATQLPPASTREVPGVYERLLASITAPIGIMLIFFFILYALLGIFGYGNDNDTYGILRSGHAFFFEGIYRSSRAPGYLIPEIVIGGASLVGGYFLTNLISAMLGTASLFFFWRLLKEGFDHFTAKMITAIVGLTPHYAIAASSSMDYIYSIFFALFGITALRKNHYYWAALLFACAASSRLSNLLTIAILYCYFIYRHYKRQNSAAVVGVFLSGLLASCLICVFYIPSFIAAGYSFGFITHGPILFTLFGYVSRVIYKNIYLFGLLPFLFLAGGLMWKFILQRAQLPWCAEIVAGLAIILVNEALFFKVPLEISYLVPLLFVVIPLVIYIWQPRRIILYVLLELVVAYGFLVNPDFLDRKYSSDGGEAIGAEVGLFLRPGVTIVDILRRDSSMEFYLLRMHIQGHYGKSWDQRVANRFFLPKGLIYSYRQTGEQRIQERATP